MSEFNATDLARISVVESLFAAWSSGDVDAPRQYLTDSPVLWDSVGGLKEGWPAIREYFGHGLERYPAFDARNLGSQVENAVLARACADAG